MWSKCLVAVCLSASSAGWVWAESSAKELFMGVNGTATQIGKPTSKPQEAAKPVRPKVLGLQTTIYQLFDDGGVKAVSPATVFAGGSRIRLGFNANRPGFLYVVNVGTSGRVSTLFPSAATDNNQVQPGLVYQVPQQTGKSIRFDTTPGQELLLVVLAESRISEFEYAGQTIALRSPAPPSISSPPVAREQKVVLAALDVSSTSKDLFVEDDGVFQTAVFNPAVLPAGGPKPLVVSLRLAHR